jgi:hypothetical protein
MGLLFLIRLLMLILLVVLIPHLNPREPWGSRHMIAPMIPTPERLPSSPSSILP